MDGQKPAGARSSVEDLKAWVHRLGEMKQNATYPEAFRAFEEAEKQALDWLREKTIEEEKREEMSVKRTDPNKDDSFSEGQR